MAYPRYNLARRHKFVVKTTGDYGPPSTTWGNVDTTTDITLEAQVGDVIEVGINATWAITNGSGNYIQVATIVSGNPINFIGSGEPSTTTGDGIPGWSASPATSSASWSLPVGPTKHYTIQSNDLSSGKVTLRLRWRTSGGTTQKLQANTIDQFEFSAKNIGPVQPN